MSKLKELVFIAITICIVSVFFTGVMEIYLRLTTHYYPDNRKDPLLGYTSVPDSEGIYEYLDNDNKPKKVQYKINSLGFRDVEHQIEKPNDTKRIMLFGDSFIAGHQVNFEDLASRKIEQFLNTRLDGQKFETFNFANIGYQASTELLVLQNLAIKYKPDYVVINFFQNDIMDLSENLENGAAIKSITHHVLENNALVVRYPAQQKISLRRSINNFLNSHSYFYRWQKEKTNIILKKFRSKLNLDYRVHSYFKSYFKILSPEIEENWKLHLALYSEMNRLAKIYNFKLLIVNLPSREIIEDNLLTERLKNIKFFDLSKVEFERQNADIRLRKYCSANNIDYIYPSNLFKSNEKKLPFCINDDHFNEFGHLLLANAITEYVIKTETQFNAKK